MRHSKLITEAQVRSAAAQGHMELLVGPKTVVTPSARDAARNLNLSFVSTDDASPDCGCAHTPIETANSGFAGTNAIVVIGSDHGGFNFKTELKRLLAKLDREIVDVGTDTEESCDYPDFAYAVAATVAAGRAALGIMIDGAGPGSAMVCNKVPGIRAACVHDEFTAWNARAHNDANVITLGSRGIGIEVARRLVKVFLDTPFEGGRHKIRVEKVLDVERRFFAQPPAPE